MQFAACLSCGSGGRCLGTANDAIGLIEGMMFLVFSWIVKTLRELLTEAEFNWNEGRIVYQRVKELLPGNACKHSVCDTVEIQKNHPVLDWRPKNSGGMRLPRVVAFDAKKIYFPVGYSCADTVVGVFFQPESYLTSQRSMTPYFRG